MLKNQCLLIIYMTILSSTLQAAVMSTSEDGAYWVGATDIYIDGLRYKADFEYRSWTQNDQTSHNDSNPYWAGADQINQAIIESGILNRSFMSISDSVISESYRTRCDSWNLNVSYCAVFGRSGEYIHTDQNQMGWTIESDFYMYVDYAIDPISQIPLPNSGLLFLSSLGMLFRAKSLLCLVAKWLTN